MVVTKEQVVMHEPETGEQAPAGIPHRVAPKSRAESLAEHVQSVGERSVGFSTSARNQSPSLRGWDRTIVNWLTVCIVVVGLCVVSGILVDSAVAHGLSEHVRLFDGVVYGVPVGGLLIALTERIDCGPRRLVLVNLFSLVELPWETVSSVSPERGVVVSDVEGVGYAANVFSFSGASDFFASRTGGATAPELAAAKIDRYRSELTSGSDHVAEVQQSIVRFRIGVVAYLAIGIGYGVAVTGILSTLN